MTTPVIIDNRYGLPELNIGNNAEDIVKVAEAYLKEVEDSFAGCLDDALENATKRWKEKTKNRLADIIKMAITQNIPARSFQIEYLSDEFWKELPDYVVDFFKDVDKNYIKNTVGYFNEDDPNHVIVSFDSVKNDGEKFRASETVSYVGAIYDSRDANRDKHFAEIVSNVFSDYGIYGYLQAPATIRLEGGREMYICYLFVVENNPFRKKCEELNAKTPQEVHAAKEEVYKETWFFDADSGGGKPKEVEYKK